MKIDAESKILFIGDSITSGARDFNQLGEGHEDAAYGNGYVRLIKSLLDAVYPEFRIRVINKGIGGNTIRDLAGRWESDVLEIRPDWLSVMIGINDVWRQFDHPLLTEIHVGKKEFEDTYRRILQTVHTDLKGLIVCSPYFIESNLGDPMREMMDSYREISRLLAAEFDAIYIDTQSVFDLYLRHYHPNQLCWDRIHPSSSGHVLIARAWLQAVQFDWVREY